tara:strand:+ start:167 stop:859 length:693 start_codon:yes stop_codon:yes gene_type:complete
MDSSDMLKYVLIIFLALVLVFIFMKLFNEQTIYNKEEKTSPVITTSVPMDNVVLSDGSTLTVPESSVSRVTADPNATNAPSVTGAPADYSDTGSEFAQFEGFENNTTLQPSSDPTGYSDSGDYADVSASVPQSENNPQVALKTCDLNKISPEELLPSRNTDFNNANPSVPNNLENKNFLEAGAHLGIDTVGQSLRNASHDLRSELPNPQNNVSPWMNTTIQPDPSRRPLC